MNMQTNQQNITVINIPQMPNGDTDINQGQIYNINCGPYVYNLNQKENPQITEATPVPITDDTLSQPSQNNSISKENQKTTQFFLNASLHSVSDISQARKHMWQEYINQIKNEETRKKEIEESIMKFDEVTMTYEMKIIGNRDENGYPLFLCLHGGGQSDTTELNDSQWKEMGLYYLEGVTNGIYVNPRGVRDTWDTHFNPESYPLYDRLIMNMIAFYDADPNRVYLTGFSAGGDGVYAIIARMSDRFAAANMSAGHPNGVSLLNLYNTPLILQVGENDSEYNRNTATAQYNEILDNYQIEFGGGYPHKCFIHKSKPHNFFDNKIMLQDVMENCGSWLKSGESSVYNTDTNAIHLLEKFVRDPIPKKIVWDLSHRADKRNMKSFYWLSADLNIKEGLIIASYDRNSNSINVEKCTAKGEISFLINDDMLDVFSPIKINLPTNSISVKVNANYDLLYETTVERGDYNYQFVAKITINL